MLIPLARRQQINEEGHETCRTVLWKGRLVGKSSNKNQNVDMGISKWTMNQKNPENADNEERQFGFKMTTIEKIGDR